MSLNAIDIDSIGVHQRVIAEVKEWRDWLDIENDDPGQRYCLCFIHFYDAPNVNQRDAEYIMQCLRVFLPLESNPQKTTVLHISGIGISDDVIAVFCNFLQRNIANLVALNLDGLPQQQFRLLLESLHTNTSVKELYISCIDDDQCAVWISNLLRRKTDLIALRFSKCRIADISLLLRRGSTHLQTLEFSRCGIGDEGTRLILEAIRDGDFPVLESLDLQRNGITSVGLNCFSLAGPVALRRVRNLNLNWNQRLLIDAESTGLFVRNMLLSEDMALKELHINNCGEHTPSIIKACESEKNKLQVLAIFSKCIRFFQPLRDQLIESLPKMNKIEHLMFCFPQVFAGDSRPSMLVAFKQNTSIVELTIYPTNVVENQRLVAPILNRNQSLKHADALLALQPKTQMPIGSKSGVWCKAFANMGKQLEAYDADNNNNNNGGYPGASAIFKILQKRHAILEKQLPRPTAAAGGRGVAQQQQDPPDNDAATRLHPPQQDPPDKDDGSGVDTDNSLETDVAGGRKRRRL